MDSVNQTVPLRIYKLKAMTTRRTKKAKVKTNPDGSKTYGPYKGSKARKGRPVVIDYKPKSKSGTGKAEYGGTTAARRAKEDSTGRKISKDKHVAHKEGTKRTDVSPSKTRVESKSKNIGDGNRSRRKKRS